VIDVEVVTGPGNWSRVGDVHALARCAVEAVFSVLPESPSSPTEISVLLTDDAGARELNRAWRGLDKPTNVLSFPAPAVPSPDGVRHLGDIALAFETVAREADDEGKSPHDHFAHLVVHGTLHLLGHDHETGEGEAVAMEALEIEALARLGIANPYRDIAP
jgi:probable rRNA maturation factor